MRHPRQHRPRHASRRGQTYPYPHHRRREQQRQCRARPLSQQRGNMPPRPLPRWAHRQQRKRKSLHRPLRRRRRRRPAPRHHRPSSIRIKARRPPLSLDEPPHHRKHQPLPVRTGHPPRQPPPHRHSKLPRRKVPPSPAPSCRPCRMASRCRSVSWVWGQPQFRRMPGQPNRPRWLAPPARDSRW